LGGGTAGIGFVGTGLGDVGAGLSDISDQDCNYQGDNQGEDLDRHHQDREPNTSY
jgi:hypothetical protein